MVCVGCTFDDGDLEGEKGWAMTEVYDVVLPEAHLAQKTPPRSSMTRNGGMFSRVFWWALW